VVYNRQPTPPPTIALEAVVESDGEGEAKPIGGGAIEVTRPRVRVTGRIEGREALVLAERAIGGAKAGRALAAFEPGRGRAFDVREPIDLAPGIQVIRFQARSDRSDPA